MQTTLENRDLEYKDQGQLMSKKLNEIMWQLALYQSFLKSKGFDLSCLNEESSDARYSAKKLFSDLIDRYFVDFMT